MMKQQDRIEDRVQDIEEQLYKLESDKCLVEVGFYFKIPAQLSNFTIYALYLFSMINLVYNPCAFDR